MPRHPLLLMVLSSACFAFMALAAKLAAGGLSGGQVAFGRFAFMLLPVVLVPPLARKAVTFQRLDLLFYRGLFGGSAVLLYFFALEHMPVGIATLLNYSSPIFSVAFAALFLGERVDGRLLLPLIAALSGMVLAAGGGGGLGGIRFGLWEALGMASAVLSGAAVTAIRAARRTEGSWAIYGSFTIFGLLATAPFGARGLGAATSREWLLLAAVGAFSIVAQLLMTYAYRWVTNLQAGVVNQLTVVLSLLLGVVFLGDRLAPVQIVGSLLTLAGVVGVVAVQSTPRAVE
ncbi:MAG TPA: DMT family transporter [Thermoanaerobaculia bacterium]|nr:DMT family transporter [Thermoanaerobaculia bacterium]